MVPRSGSIQASVALDDDLRLVIADTGIRALSAQRLPTSAFDSEVGHDRERRHYGAVLNGNEIGWPDYTLTGHRIVLSVLVIASRFQQRRIITEPARRVLDNVCA